MTIFKLFSSLVVPEKASPLLAALNHYHHSHRCQTRGDCGGERRWRQVPQQLRVLRATVTTASQPQLHQTKVPAGAAWPAATPSIRTSLRTPLHVTTRAPAPARALPTSLKHHLTSHMSPHLTHCRSTGTPGRLWNGRRRRRKRRTCNIEPIGLQRQKQH